jgi:hypothetical protein
LRDNIGVSRLSIFKTRRGRLARMSYNSASRRMFARFLVDALCRDAGDAAQVLPIWMRECQPVDGIRGAACPSFATPMPRIGRRRPRHGEFRGQRGQALMAADGQCSLPTCDDSHDHRGWRRRQWFAPALVENRTGEPGQRTRPRHPPASSAAGQEQVEQERALAVFVHRRFRSSPQTGAASRWSATDYMIRPKAPALEG